MNTPATKRWVVNAVSEGQLPLSLFGDGRPLTQNTSTIADSIMPVQYLLMSVATCFALSCRAVLTCKRLGQVSFEVVVIGEKQAPVTDNRLSRIAVVALFGNGISESEAALIIDQAKPLCTVTNTILDSPVIDYSSRAVKVGHTRFLERPDQHPPH